MLLLLACTTPSPHTGLDTGVDSGEPIPFEELYAVVYLDGREDVDGRSTRASHWVSRGSLPVLEPGDCTSRYATITDGPWYSAGEVQVRLDGEPLESTVSGWPAGSAMTVRSTGDDIPAFQLEEPITVPPWVDLQVQVEEQPHGASLKVSWTPTEQGLLVVRLSHRTDPESSDIDTCVFPASAGQAEVTADDTIFLWEVDYVTETHLPVSPTQGVLIRTQSGVSDLL